MKTNAQLVMMSKQVAIEKMTASLSESIAKKGLPGFQSSHPHFSEEVIGGVSFLKYNQNIKNTERGPIEHTGQKLHIAVNRGYFAVMTPEGVRYTRNGSFRRSVNGEVINSKGYPLLDEGGSPVVVSNVDSLVIGRDGSFSVSGEFVGRLQVVDFDDLQDLNDERNPGFFETQQEGVRPENLVVQQGYLEGSNVDAVKSLVEFSILSHRWRDSHHFQKKHHELELEAPSKLAPVN